MSLLYELYTADTSYLYTKLTVSNYTKQKHQTRLKEITILKETLKQCYESIVVYNQTK